jgi:EmrB/QacA subfamily drug resistance transporter
MATKDRLTNPRARWIALIVICLGQLMSILDATIVNVALPHIQRDLHFTQSSLSWVINGYLITFGSFLLLGGRLGDLIGRRRMFISGIILFMLASLACGLAETQTVLILARFLQGVGGAAAVSVTVAIISTEFPDPGERAQAMSLYMFVIAGGGSLGLILGGVITELVNWHWIFFINIPIGLVAVLLGRVWIVENKGLGIGRDLDVLGSVLVTGALISLAYAIVTASTHGWVSAHTLGYGGLAIGLLVAFIVAESKLPKPIMPLRVFRLPGLAGTSLIRGLLMAGVYSTFFIGVLYLEQVRGDGVLTTGFSFLAQTAVMGALSLGPTRRLVARFGPRPVVVAGLICALAGLALFSRVGLHTSYVPLIIGSMMLVGAGAGLAMMPLLTLAMAEVPPVDAGLASGIVNTSLQVSAAIGVALFGTLSTDRTRSLLAGGHSQLPALLSGYRLAFTVGAGCVAVALIFALVWFAGTRAKRSPAASGRNLEPALSGARSGG